MQDGSEDTPGGLTPFAITLREAISDRGLTLTQLRERLISTGNPVSLATLSSWRAGSRQPEGPTSQAAVEELERILGMEPLDLVGKLGESRRLGRPPEVKVGGADDYDYPIETMLSALGCTAADLGAAVAQSTTVRVGPDRRHLTYLSRVTLQPSRRLVRFPSLVMSARDGHRISPDAPNPFTAIRGGRAAALEIDHQRAYYGVAIELDHPLEPGSLAIVEIEFTMPIGCQTVDRVQHAVHRRLRDVSVWVQFDPAARPRELVRSVQTGDSLERRVVQDPTDGECQLAIGPFGPGVVSLEWTW